MGELRFEHRNVDYAHDDGADPTNGSGIEFQSKTPRSTGIGGSSRDEKSELGTSTAGGCASVEWVSQDLSRET